VGVTRHEDLIAFQLAEAFKNAIYLLVRNHPSAAGDFHYKDQLFQASSGPPAHIAEGFARRRPKEFAHYLSYARGSIAEAQTRLMDGVDRGHFGDSEIAEARELGRRAIAAVAGLQRAIAQFK
jgi:four helix bundle protein